MNKIKLVTAIVGGGMFLFLLYSFIVNNYFELGYPYNTFLSSKIDCFMDFYNVNYFVHDFNPYSSNKNVSYPPFALILAYPFSLFYNYSKHGSVSARESVLPVLSYLILVLSFSYFLLKLIYQTIKGNGKLNDYIVTVVLFLTYPVFYLLNCGNYIMITFIFLYFFVFYYTTNPRKSLFFLSAAIAMKIYPIMFILLFLAKKRYRDILSTVVMTGCLSLIPMLLFKGSFYLNIINFINNLLFFSHGHVNEIQNMSWSSSLSGIFKIPIMLSNHGTVPFDIKLPYLVLVVVLTGIVIFLLKKENDLCRCVIYLLSLQILIMPVSYDYSLIYLYIPLLLLLNKQKDLEREDFFSITVIAILFIPKSYGILFHDWIWTVSIQSFITPLLLLLLIIYPFSKRMSKGLFLKKVNNEANFITS